MTPDEQIGRIPRKAAPVREDRSAEAMLRRFMLEVLRQVQGDIKKNLMPAIEYNVTTNEGTQDAAPVSIVEQFRQMVARWSNSVFLNMAQTKAEEFSNKANETNAKRFERQMAAMSVPVFASVKGLSDYLDLASADVANLIVSIPEQHIKQVRQAVTTNMRSGLRSSQLIPEINKLLKSEYAKRKGWAEFVARDQTAKLNSELNRKRQKAVGFEYFQWLDSSDARVRSSHERIADKVTKYGKGIYRWDNLPINERGERIAPGEDFRCRCVARPVTQIEVDRNRKMGNVGGDAN